MDSQSSVCLNDGRGKRLNVRTGTLTMLDLTCVSGSLPGGCQWEMWGGSTAGREQFHQVDKRRGELVTREMVTREMVLGKGRRGQVQSDM